MSPVGSFQPACGGTCLIDHAEGDLVYVTYLLYLLPLLVTIVFEGEAIFKLVNIVVWIFFFVFWVLSVYFLSATYLTEPGVIPKGTALTAEQIKSITETASQRLLRQMFTAIREGSYNRVDELLLHNPNLVSVNEENNEGRTALHIAAFKGDLVICDRLLHHGALLKVDRYMLNPMHYAAYEGHEDVVNLFLKHNHDLDNSVSISTGVIESEDTNEGDNGSLDSDNILDLMVNRVKSELGPDLASLKGECTILPPFTGIPRSLLFDGHVMSCGTCRTCYLNLPPRAQHCRFCDCCIMRYDHHCPWVSNCVGLRNHRFFFGFLVSTLLLIIFAIAMFVIVLVKEGQEYARTMRGWMLVLNLLQHHFSAIVIGLFCLIMLIPVSILVVDHFCLIAKNMTTQDFRRQNYKFISNPVYDQGIWSNLRNELFTYHPSMVASTVISNRNMGNRGSVRKDMA
ncbi:hypothetical protein WA171_004855 [Blastocystis sp. BT1]